MVKLPVGTTTHTFALSLALNQQAVLPLVSDRLRDIQRHDRILLTQHLIILLILRFQQLLLFLLPFSRVLMTSSFMIILILQLNHLNGRLLLFFQLMFLSQRGAAGWFCGDLLVHLHEVLLEDALVVSERALVMPSLQVAQPPRVLAQRQHVLLEKFRRFAHKQGALAAVNVEAAGLVAYFNLSGYTCMLVLGTVFSSQGAIDVLKEGVRCLFQALALHQSVVIIFLHQAILWP